MVHYRIRNMSTNRSISITDIYYNPNNYELTITFNNNDPDWDYSTTYEVWIQAAIKNLCGDTQGGAVTTNFTTQPPGLNSLEQTGDFYGLLIPISAQSPSLDPALDLGSVASLIERMTLPFILPGEHIYLDEEILWLWRWWLHP